MKVYIAAPFSRREEVKELQKKFIELGYEISADWTLHRPIQPYKENQDTARVYAKEDMAGVIESDVFILLPEGGENSNGHKIEFGAALASNLLRGKPIIYVVGDFSRTIFNYHHAVKHCDSIKEIFPEIDQ